MREFASTGTDDGATMATCVPGSRSTRTGRDALLAVDLQLDPRGVRQHLNLAERRVGRRQTEVETVRIEREILGCLPAVRPPLKGPTSSVRVHLGRGGAEGMAGVGGPDEIVVGPVRTPVNSEFQPDRIGQEGRLHSRHIFGRDRVRLGSIGIGDVDRVRAE